MDRRNFIARTMEVGLTMGSLDQLQAFAQTLPPSDPMPALFLGHGSPMNAIEENRFVKEFRRIEKTIPRPNAILCISAHWFTRGTKVTSMNSPRTIHDFGGFPKELYEVRYPAPGNLELAQAASKIIDQTEVQLDEAWGLDHGAWSVLKLLYPKAEIPVVQLSIDRTQSPQFHFELGRQMDILRHRGILIVGSGNIVHNLRRVDFKNMNRPNYGYDWAIEAQDFVNRHLQKGDYNPLINYLQQGQAVNLAVPTPDHYLPLLYVLGLSHKPEQLTLFNDELIAGSLSMTSVRIG